MENENENWKKEFYANFKKIDDMNYFQSIIRLTSVVYMRALNIAGVLDLIGENRNISYGNIKNKVNVSERVLLSYLKDSLKNGWVEKKRDNQDKRITKYTLTNKGRNFIDEATKVYYYVTKLMEDHNFLDFDELSESLDIKKLPNGKVLIVLNGKPVKELDGDLE